MLKTLSRKSLNYISILIVITIIISFFSLFMGNLNLNKYNSVDELINNQEISCNQHYWTLKNKLDDFGDYTVSVVPKDIDIYPEINNILCLGKALNIVIDGKSIYVVSGTSQKVFVYLCLLIFTLFMVLLQLFKNEKKLIISLWIFSLIFIQLYLFSSFNNPLIIFVNLIILVMLATIVVDSFSNQRFKHLNLLIYLFCIVVCAIVFLKYIYFDYVIYLTIFGIIFLKCFHKIFNLKNLDIGYLILITHIGLILGGVDYPLSRNHNNYFPSILHKYNSNFFEFHYLSEMVYPYPLFESITLFFLKIFGLNLINFLNYFSYFFGYLIILMFIKFLFQKNWIKICLILSILQGRVLIFSLFDDFGWYRNVYSTSFIKLGIGDNVILTHLYEPSSFDVLVLLVIVFLINKNFVIASVTSIIAIFLHTYNILPIFVIYLSYLITSEKDGLKIINKIKKSSLLLFSLPIIYLTNVFSLRDSSLDIQKADSIMTHERIPMHRLFNGNFSFLNDSSQFDFKGQTNATGFSFEIEFLIFTVLLFFLIKNPLLKKVNILIFITTISSLVFVYFFDNNFASSQIRNVVPWRMSSLIYLFGIVYALNLLITKVKIKKLYSLILIFILSSIFYLSNNADVNENRLRATYVNTELVDGGQNLINPSDILVVFGLSNIWNQKTYTFISTSETYYGHPYKPSEIVNWKKNIDQTYLFFNSNPNCRDFEEFIVETKNSRAIFSSVEFIPNSIMSCSNMVEKDYFGYYVFEIDKSE